MKLYSITAEALLLKSEVDEPFCSTAGGDKL